MMSVGLDMPNTFETDKDILILDGGLGSDLFINGGFDEANLNEDPLWLARVTYENPNAIKEAHKRFIKAGSDVISTGSYQASVDGYVEHAKVTIEKAEEIIASSVDIAHKAILECAMNKKIMIAGSISPYGAVLHDMSEYTGTYIDKVSFNILKDFHQINIRILANKGVDIFAFETLPALKEALALAEVLKQYPNCKAWVSFTTKDGEHTSYGDSFKEVFETLASYPQVIAVGSNCCDAKFTNSILECAKGTLGHHQMCIVYPDNRQNSDSSLMWLPYVKQWLDSKIVKFIGGCCLTSPEHIRQVKSVVDEWKLAL